jgi:hypothetical protein
VARDLQRSEGDLRLDEEIVQECLAHGWVDSLTRGKDARRSMLWISPRGAARTGAG